MAPAHAITRLSKHDPIVAGIVLAWRRLASEGEEASAWKEKRTLLACSGGADSSAMVLALATAGGGGAFAVGHVVHDLRPAAEAEADRDQTRELAESLGLEFAEARVCVRDEPGNAEASARRLRYRALRDLALEHGCSLVATGHQGDDQFETMLMGLIRGAGPRGLAGVAPRRPIEEPAVDRKGEMGVDGGGGIMVIRPMLGVGRADCERLCRDAGWTWATDRTNADVSRLRSAIRHGAAAELERLRPGAAIRAAKTARLLRQAAGVIDDRAQQLVDAAREPGHETGIIWPRDVFTGERAVVVGAALRLAASRLRRGKERGGEGDWAGGDWGGGDRFTERHVTPIVRAIRDGIDHPRRFELSGMTVTVLAHTVEMQRKGSDG